MHLILYAFFTFICFSILVSLCPQFLMKALQCYEPAENRSLITPLSARLCTYKDFKAQDGSSSPGAVAKDGVSKSKFNLHGTLVVQTLLNFNKPIKVRGNNYKLNFCLS